MSEKVKVCSADEVCEDEVLRVELEGYPSLAVYRVEGKFFVTNDTCTHAQASLSEGWLEGHIIACPVHDGEFDIRDGAPKCFPVTEPLPVYKAWDEDGLVFADLSDARESLVKCRAREGGSNGDS